MTFLYPAFLFALGAIAIPIVLHLVQLRRAKRIQFSNVKLIQVSKDLTASQRNLKQLLILLCRILFIVFLVLAFAQPFIPALQSQAQTSTSKVSLLVDNSFSMENTSSVQDLPLLAAVVDRAKSIMSLFPTSTTYTLLASGSSYSGVRTNDDVVIALDNMNYSAVNQLATQIVKDNSTLFVLSDFQKSTFKPKFIQNLDSTSQVHMVPMQAAQTNNIIIDSVFLEDEFVREDAENILHVTLFNESSDAFVDLPVKLSIEGEQVAVLSIDVPAKQFVEAKISFRVKGKSSKKASVLIEDYPVVFDNTYFFTLPGITTISVVALTDKPQYSLANLYKAEPSFKFYEFSSTQIDYSQLEKANIVVLNGLTSINPALAATIVSFIKSGGTVAVLPATDADKSSYESFFQQLEIAANFTDETTQSIKTRVQAPPADHPFFKSIFSAYTPDIDMPASVRSIVWTRATEDILKFKGGSAYLSKFSRGAGYLYLFAAPLDADYNTLPNHALFVPVMYKIAMTSYKQLQAMAYTLDTEGIELPVVTTSRQDGIYTLKKDSLAYIPEQQVLAGKLLFNVPPAMAEAGFYALQLQDSVLTTLAFNYAKDESYLAQYTPQELRGMVGSKYNNVHVYDYNDDFSAKAAFEKQFFGIKLWKYCLILCLFFLMAEIALIRLL